jgi:hypothetical protein
MQIIRARFELANAAEVRLAVVILRHQPQRDAGRDRKVCANAAGYFEVRRRRRHAEHRHFTACCAATELNERNESPAIVEAQLDRCIEYGRGRFAEIDAADDRQACLEIAGRIADGSYDRRAMIDALGASGRLACTPYIGALATFSDVPSGPSTKRWLSR